MDDQPYIEALTFDNGWIPWACSTRCKQPGGCWGSLGEVHIHVEDIPKGSSGLDVGGILRAQQATIAELREQVESLQWANVFRVAGEIYRTCIDCKREPGGGHASKCRIRDAAGVEAGVPAALGEGQRG